MDCWYCHGDVEESGREMKKQKKKKKKEEKKWLLVGNKWDI